MRQFFVGGNWKCNGTTASVAELVSGLNAEALPTAVEVVCSPPFLFLDQVQGAMGPGIAVAAQNCWTGAGGAYTGEVSADMIADKGLKWVILGHSERRALCGEDNETVATKTKYAQEAGLDVILCIGETLEEREGGSMFDVLDAQMGAVVAAGVDWARVVVAYEPVWAIGTGVVATPEQAQEVHEYLRKWMAERISPEVGADTRIIYGGSVNPGNCDDLATRDDIDGFLVGGASLKAADFGTIVRAGEKSLATSA